MANQPIDFKKERDFGDIFSESFNFIGQEFKRLGRVILYYVVPVLILSSIAITFYTIKVQELSYSLTANAGSSTTPSFQGLGSMLVSIFIYFVLYLLATTLLFCAVYCYIKLYITRGNDNFTVNDVWNEMIHSFVGILIATFVTGIVIMIGFACCIIPGIYIGIALSALFCIMIFEDLSFSKAFSKSLKIINPNWFLTLGICIVSTIIIYILSILVSIPAIAFGFKDLFFNLKHLDKAQMNYSMGFYLWNSLAHLLTQVFMVIPIVITAFMYFSYREKIEKPSLYEKINQIGKDE
jgi:hypothetical protein